MSKLSTLRSKLAGLRRRRAAVRWGTAWSGFGVAVLGTIVAAFLVDWLFRTSVSQRLVLWGAGLAVVAWAWWRNVRPSLGTHETDEDVALFVERQQGIDSDLVAAMQFEHDDAGRTGSRQLESAVVDYVSDFSSKLDVYEGLDTSTFARRAGLLAASLLCIVLGALLLPGHAAAFGNRMLLGRAHYPTATRIEAVAVNDLAVQSVSPQRVDELETLRRDAIAAQDRLQVELNGLRTAARAVSDTSDGWYDSWFGPNEPVANAARAAGDASGDLAALRRDARTLRFTTLDDPSDLVRGQRSIARTLDQLAGSEELTDIAAPLAEARSAAHAAVAAVGRLVPTVPYGKPLEFRVTVSAESPEDIPATARVELRSLVGDVRTELELVAETDPENLEPDPDDGRYRVELVGELPRMVDTVGYRILAGDAFTDPNVVAVVPLPSVSVELTTTPPAYAAGEHVPAPAGQLQQSVVEGSRVELVARSASKPLTSATLTIDETAYPLQPDETGRNWTLDVAGTPFEEVREAIRFEVAVEDVDGLALERPIQGFLRLDPDRAPRISADIKYGLPISLPNATRTLDFRAADDHGLSRVAMTMHIVREDGRESTDLRVLRRVESNETPARELAGEYTLDLAPLGLSLGDELKLTFEATDFRGTLEAETTLAEPITFRIASEAEVLREMQKHDVKAEQALDAIQRRELGIGESP